VQSLWPTADPRLRKRHGDVLRPYIGQDLQLLKARLAAANTMQSNNSTSESMSRDMDSRIANNFPRQYLEAGQLSSE